MPDIYYSKSWLGLGAVICLLATCLATEAVGVGDRVQVVAASIEVDVVPCGHAVGFETMGSLGVVAGGPSLCTALYWNVSFDNGLSGWVRQDVITSVAPSPPKLVSPGSATAPGETVTNLTPQLLWDTAPGATNYLVAVGVLSQGGVFAIFTSSAGKATSFTLPPGVLSFGLVYAWDVTAQNSVGSSDPSTRLYFQVQRPPPPVPVPVSPGAATNPGPTITGLTPVLSWNAVAGATGYGIYIYDVAAHSYPYLNEAVGNTTALTLPAGALASSRVYGWQMRANSASGFSAYSDFLYFQTPAPAPSLAYSLSGKNLVLCWPTNGSGYILESTVALAPAAWSTVWSTPAVVNTNFVLTNPFSANPRFFRLKQ